MNLAGHAPSGSSQIKDQNQRTGDVAEGCTAGPLVDHLDQAEVEAVQIRVDRCVHAAVQLPISISSSAEITSHKAVNRWGIKSCETYRDG